MIPSLVGGGDGAADPLEEVDEVLEGGAARDLLPRRASSCSRSVAPWTCFMASGVAVVGQAAEVEHRHHPRVVEVGEDARLVEEAGQGRSAPLELGAEALDRHPPLEPQVSGAVDHRHPPSPSSPSSR